jgi:dihydroorotate dehydrogenase (fumarate)
VEQRLLDVAPCGCVSVAVRSRRSFVGRHLAQRLTPWPDGLVIFNRFYQPDIDPEALNTAQLLQLSDSSELLLRLRWLAILSGRVRASLAATGGVHTAVDAIKAVMAGAHAVQFVAALLMHGPAQLTRIRQDVVRWLDEHEYLSIEQARGSMNLLRCPDPEAFERGNYMKILQTWKAR